MYINQTDRVEYMNPQILLYKIKNKTSPLKPDKNIFIQLTKKCKKPALKAKYKYFYITHKEM